MRHVVTEARSPQLGWVGKLVVNTSGASARNIFMGLLSARNAVTSAGVRNLAAEGGLVHL